MKSSYRNNDREAQREIITAIDSQFISFKADTDMWTTWHYHPEIDILLTLKNTGKAFISYVNELRVGLACRRIIETDASISEICFGSGFNNLSNFNRRFKELKGVSPRDLRAQYRGQLSLV